MSNSHTILTYPHTLVVARSRGLALTRRVAHKDAILSRVSTLSFLGLDEEFAAIEGNTSSGEEGNTSDEDSDGEGFQI